MTLKIAHLREQIATQVGFADVEQIDESIIRAVRESESQPFAVYYFDITDKLPQTKEKLTSYQDRVIGRRYFEGRKSLQWSNYLYFLTSAERWKTPALRETKELIELDRLYARKFVIREEEIESVLKPPVVSPSAKIHQVNILSTWSDLLAEKGLDAAVLSDDDLPTRLSLIENPPTTKTPKPKARATQTGPATFLESLQLKKFRPFPMQRDFDFGRVNLIVGPNGSGKTSLLEAIELFYCGRNKRNPASTSRYELVAHLSGGRTEKATRSRDLQLFRDRNLGWYGQAEVKTNRLYLSFSQFNFLDTDAAVSLSDSTETLEEDLSNLLVGPDASKTWHNIERVSEAVTSKLRELQPLKEQVTDELAILEKQLKARDTIPHESDSIRSRLIEMLGRLGWTSEFSPEALDGRVVGPLSELAALARQASEASWTQSPVSLKALANYMRETDLVIERVEPDLIRFDTLVSRQVTLAVKHKNDLAARGIAEEASVLIDRGIPNRIAERNRDQGTLTTCSEWLTGYDDETVRIIPEERLDTQVARFQEIATAGRQTAESELVVLKEEYDKFLKLRDESVSLGQQLRQIATRILTYSTDADVCPLCHTSFGPGELLSHISEGVDEHLERQGQSLFTRLQEREKSAEIARAVAVAAEWINAFSLRAHLSEALSVRSALSRVEEAKQTLQAVEARLRALNVELLRLESHGLSGMEPNEISDRLRQFGYPLADFSRVALGPLLAAIDENLAASTQTMERERKEIGELEKRLQQDLHLAGVSVDELEPENFKRALSQLRERQTTTKLLQDKLSAFLTSFPWPNDRPFSELVVEAESARTIAADLQTALGREKQAQTTEEESIKRKKHLEQQRDKLLPRITRFTAAQDNLEELRLQHSLSGAMEDALTQNKTNIELIFSRIHSPAEFSGLGQKWTTLVRKASRKEAQLSEISTGQRAAFALSIFLAQNAQLSTAPPVILIDDPIAHIDDLNSLSFLDYLREIILTGKRQVFFATANDKLATLFERKFDFLGAKNFCRFDFPPHPLSSTT